MANTELERFDQTYLRHGEKLASVANFSAHKTPDGKSWFCLMLEYNGGMACDRIRLHGWLDCRTDPRWVEFQNAIHGQQGSWLGRKVIVALDGHGNPCGYSQPVLVAEKLQAAPGAAPRGARA